MRKYIIYDTELVSLKWIIGSTQKLLVFDTEESAKRFIQEALKIPLFCWHDTDYYTTAVYPAIEISLDCFNATNLIPVQNGDDIELKEVES